MANFGGGTTKVTEIGRASEVYRVLTVLTVSLILVCLLGYAEWLHQVAAFHLSIQEYAESLVTHQ